MIEIFSGRHGKPEGAFVAACRMMEDMAPAVSGSMRLKWDNRRVGGEQGRISPFS